MVIVNNTCQYTQLIIFCVYMYIIFIIESIPLIVNTCNTMLSFFVLPFRLKSDIGFSAQAEIKPRT
jgi:hypothetical protein